MAASVASATTPNHTVDVGRGQSIIWCVLGEVEHVLSALCANKRFASRSSFHGGSMHLSSTDDPRVKKLKSLRKRLRTCASAFASGQVGTLDRLEIISPFVDVIRASDTTGDMTNAALQSVIRLMEFGIFQLETDEAARRARIPDAVSILIEGVANCRFQMADPTLDENVLYHVLLCLRSALTSRWGCMMDDEAVWSSIEAIFRMTQEQRRSPLLRTAAASTMASVVHSVFGGFERLVNEEISMVRTRSISSIRPDMVPRRSSSAPPATPARMRDEGGEGGYNSEAEEVKAKDAVETRDDGGAPVEEPSGEEAGAIVSPDSDGRTDEESPAPVSPLARRASVSVVADRSYGLPVALKMLHFLVAMIDPELSSPKIKRIVGSNGKAREIQALGLRLLDVALKVIGASLATCDPAVALIQDDVCKFLIQTMLRTPSLLSGSLQVFRTLIVYLRPHLKMQIELLFNSVYLRALSGQIKSPESVEVVLESLCDVGSIPTLWTELYCNYDCDPKCTNVMENLCKFLSKNTFPVFIRAEKLHVLGQPQLLSLKSIINGLRFIADRCIIQEADDAAPQEEGEVPRAETEPSLSQYLCKKREEKTLRAKVAVAFNAKPKKLLKFLVGHNLVEEGAEVDVQAREIANFLRYTPMLDKTSVGQFLGSGETELAKSVRIQYIRTFSLENHPMLGALRTFLEAFRLPGEAQQIDRLLQAFASETHQKSSDGPMMATDDVAYLLSFSIIMLNTDLHNPNIKLENKMSLSAFVKQNTNYGQEVSQGRDLPLDYLVGIYNSIKTNEIRKFDEDDDGILVNLMTNDLWSDLISRANKELPLFENPGQYIVLRNSPAHSAQDQTGSNELNAGVYDAEVFSLVWGSSINALSVTFDTVNEGKVMELGLDGFILTAKIAAAYQLSSIFDNVVRTLVRFSTWAEDASSSMEEDDDSGRNTPLTEEQLDSQMQEKYDSTIEAFGSNHKAQMATIAVFGVIRKFGSTLRTGWRSILQILMRMRTVGLLPRELCQPLPNEISTEAAKRHFQSLVNAAQRRKALEKEEEAKRNAGFFSWIFGGNEKKRVRDGITGEQIRVLEDLLEQQETADSAARNSQKTDDTMLEDELMSMGIEATSADDSVENSTRAARCILSCRLVEFLEETRFFSNEAVHKFIDALKSAAIEGMNDSLSAGFLDTANGSDSKADDEAIAKMPQSPSRTNSVAFSGLSQGSTCFCLESMTTLVLQNRDRLDVVLDPVLSFFVDILTRSAEPDGIVDVAGRGIIRMAVRLSHKPSLVDKLVNTLLVLLPSSCRAAKKGKQKSKKAVLGESVSAVVGDALSGYLGNGVLDLVQGNASTITAPATWRNLFLLLKYLASHKMGAQNGFQSVSFLLRDPHMRACVPLTISSTVVAYATSTVGAAAPGAKSGRYSSLAALDLLFNLHQRVKPLMKRFSEAGAEKQDDNANADGGNQFDPWHDCWQPVLNSMAACLRDRRKPVKLYALNLIQRSLVDTHGDYLSASQWKAVFDTFLFPIASSLLRNETKAQLTAPSDRQAKTGVEQKSRLKTSATVISDEMRVAAVSIVSKIYLSRLSLLVGLPNFQVVWIQILRFMEQFMDLGISLSSKHLTETVLETCKNMLLVMQGNEMFDDTVAGKSGDERKELWNITSNSMKVFCGEKFLQNLFPNGVLAAASSTDTNVPDTLENEEVPTAVSNGAEEVKAGVSTLDIEINAESVVVGSGGQEGKAQAVPTNTEAQNTDTVDPSKEV